MSFTPLSKSAIIPNPIMKKITPGSTSPCSIQSTPNHKIAKRVIKLIKNTKTTTKDNQPKGIILYTKQRFF